ncbi:MAG: hypothetical protein ACKPKO_48225, partial [Candidatus Fonsibacter sp.]
PVRGGVAEERLQIIKELLIQHHNFYLNISYKLLTNNGVDVYTVTDAFTIRQSQLETARELLNWEDGIGNWRLNMTEEDQLDGENATCCSICKQELQKKSKRVRYHDHRTGKYRRCAHDRCNIN